VIWRRGAFEIEVEWDHGPDVWITFYGHRTHMFGISYVAYPVLSAPKRRPIDYESPNFLGVLDRMWKQVYADSPTETPFMKMVKDLPRHGKSIRVVNRMIRAMEAMVETEDGTRFEPRQATQGLEAMVEAADLIADDPINDPELRDKMEEAGRQVERKVFGFDPAASGLHCAICGIGVTVPVQHDVDMCGVCWTELRTLPPITYISDGNGTSRAFTFGTGIEAHVVVLTYTALTKLPRSEIGFVVAQTYRRATEVTHSVLDDRNTFDPVTKSRNKQPDT
jgi:hypothetical protein